MLKGKTSLLTTVLARENRSGSRRWLLSSVKLKVDIIVTAGSPGVAAAKQATTTIPIVIAAIRDAVESGFVTSLARPGGNITGLSFLNAELEGKRLELLKEAVPRLSRIALLHHGPLSGASSSKLKAVGQSLSLKLQFHSVQGAEDFDKTFSAIKHDGAEALQVLASPTLAAHRKSLVRLAMQHRLPTVYQWKEFVEVGGLMSYAANLTDMYRRAAVYVDKILRGAKPADLPVEQPTKFELVINLKTAKQLGLTIPPNVLARADRVIK
jgi:putative ABC transport system substrate-binding protein